MIRLIYFEIRKNYLRKYIILAILLFLIVNSLYIYKNYLGGNSSEDDYFLSPTSQHNMLKFYNEMHNKLDGELTAKKAEFVVKEKDRLELIVGNGTYSKEYQKDTYTGYLFGDYFIIKKYFYQPIMYAATYKNKNSQIVEKAKENIEFYKKYENDYEVSRNQFILDNYQGRSINSFYDGKPWELLFDYDFSDLLILLLLLLGIAPIFIIEKENKMDTLILSSKNGKADMIHAKICSVFLYIAFLVVIFAILNLILFKIFYNLSGIDMPIYAIETYQYTPLNLSVGVFYIIIISFKLIGFLVFGMVLGVLSALFSKVVYPYMIGALLTIGGLYTRGFLMSVKFEEIVMALLSPFSLLKGNKFYIKLFDFRLGDYFMLRSNVCLMLQSLIIVILYLIIRNVSKRADFRLKKLIPVRRTEQK